jgi:hypothetical protein
VRYNARPISVHSETRNCVLNRGALENVTAGICQIFRGVISSAQQRIKEIEPFLDGH